MIRLNHIILLVCAVTVGVIAVVFYREMDKVITDRSAAIKRLQEESVHRFTATAIEARAYWLESVRKILADDERLGRDFVQHHSKSASYRGELESASIKRKADCDFVQIIAITDTKNLSEILPHELLQKASGEESAGIFLGEYEKEPALISFSPIKEFGGAVAVAILGYKLNGKIASDVFSATQSKVLFATSKTTIGVNPLSLTKRIVGREHLTLTVSSDVVPELNRALSGGVGTVGLISLVLSTLLFCALFQLFFLSGFRRVLRAINASVESLRQGEIAEIPRERFSVKEISELSAAVSSYTESLSDFEKQVQRKASDEIAGRWASQIVHDLGAVTAAFEQALSVNNYQEFSNVQKQTLQHCMMRLRGIAKNTLQKMKGVKEEDEAISAEVIPLLLEMIVGEKKAAHAAKTNLSLVFENKDCRSYASVQPQRFLRALSNIIENAVEACVLGGEVRVICDTADNSLRIRVQDTGVGIPAHILSRLGRRGFTFGKANGSGLGLWYAKEAVEAWGGTLEIRSSEGIGSELTFTLPSADRPEWFASEVRIPEQGEIVVLDDENEIHEAWNGRFSALGVSVRHLFSAERFVMSTRTKRSDQLPELLLCDFVFAEEPWNGLQLIEELELSEHAILVTHHFQDEQVRKECKRLGVRILPKKLLDRIEIVANDGVVQRGRRSV